MATSTEHQRWRQQLAGWSTEQLVDQIETMERQSHDLIEKLDDRQLDEIWKLLRPEGPWPSNPIEKMAGLGEYFWGCW